MKTKTQSMDNLDHLKEQSRLDLQILSNIDLPNGALNMDNSDTDTFKNLDEECERSLYSTPRDKFEGDMLAYDRVMPFDFVTHRKAKRFFHEPCYDLDTLLLNKKPPKFKDQINKQYGKKPQNSSSEENGSEADENEANKLREIPYLNDNIKKKLRVEPKKNKKRKKVKLTIKGEMSSSSDDEKFDKYNYAQKV